MSALTRMVDTFRYRLASRFVRRLYRVTHRSPIQLRAVAPSQVLVVAPHSDDEVLGAGGTLALHQLAGSKITIACVTSDIHAVSTSASATRMREAASVASTLGAELHFLGHRDGHVSRSEACLIGELATMVDRLQPDIVFTPFPLEQHRDHQAVARACSLALTKSNYSGQVWAYEIWAPLWPNVAIDITLVSDRKRDLIALYNSQVEHTPYSDAVLGLNSYRGLQVYKPQAEAFHVSSAAHFEVLCRELDYI